MSEQHFNINYAKSLPRNITTNIIALIINTLVGLLITPFFLDTLGQATYALIPLATSITNYVTLIVDILNASVSRYLTIELQQGDFKKANETYSTSFIILIACVAILIPIILLISCIAPHIFQAGEIPGAEATIFFVLILGSVLISTLKSNFMAILFSYNRLDLRNIVSIVQIVTQVGLIIAFFSFYSPSLFFVGTGYFTAAIVSFGVAYLLSKTQTRQVKFSTLSWNKRRVRELFMLSFYILFDALGCIILANVGLIIVNMYFGAELQAEYSLVVTWTSFLVALGGVVTNTMAPKIYSLIGLNDTKTTISFISTATKLIGLILALPIALLCIFSPQLMTIWVGEQYVILTPLVWILLPIQYCLVLVHCQNAVAISKNKMQFPAALHTIAGIIYIGLASTFPLIFNNGYYGVAIAYIIVMAIDFGIICPMYYNYLLNRKLFTFILKSIPGLVGMGGLMVFGVLYTSLIQVDGVLSLIISGLVISCIYAFIILKLVLSKEEKELAKTCLPEFLQKMKIVQCI